MNWIKKHRLAILITGFVIYIVWASSVSNSNLLIKKSATSFNTPDQVVRLNYDWYLTCIKNHFNNPSRNKSPQQDCPYNGKGYLTTSLNDRLIQEKGFDAVLCAQNTPTSISYSNAVVVKIGTATDSVNLHWGLNDQEITIINVGLQQVDKQWKISSITCPTQKVITPTPCPTLEGEVNQITYGSCISPTPLPTPMPIGLSFANQSMANGVYPNYYPTFTAELHNYSPILAYKNIVVRFSFYKQHTGSCLDPANDNQYVTVSNYIASGDSQAIKTLVQTNFDTSGAFTWCASIFNYQYAH